MRYSNDIQIEGIFVPKLFPDLESKLASVDELVNKFIKDENEPACDGLNYIVPLVLRIQLQVSSYVSTVILRSHDVLNSRMRARGSLSRKRRTTTTRTGMDWTSTVR